MRTKISRWVLSAGVVTALAACAATEKRAGVESKSYAGWYMEHAGQGMIQLCGQSQQWRVSGSTELRTKAQAFGLDQAAPVYVRVLGTQSASSNELQVSKVEQFASTTPVRNCGMTGVVIPAPAPAEH